MQAPANSVGTTTTSQGLIDSAVLAATHRPPEAIRTIMLPIPRVVPVGALTSCVANTKAYSRPRTRDMEMAAACDIGCTRAWSAVAPRLRLEGEWWLWLAFRSSRLGLRVRRAAIRAWVSRVAARSFPCLEMQARKNPLLTLPVILWEKGRLLAPKVCHAVRVRYHPPCA